MKKSAKAFIIGLIGLGMAVFGLTLNPTPELQAIASIILFGGWITGIATKTIEIEVKEEKKSEKDKNRV